jgi:hypothetical protein
MSLHQFPRPALRVAQQAPTGHYGYAEPVSDRDRIEITAGLSKVYAVRIDGVIWAEFATLSNAARCASALMTLEGLGLLPALLARTA